MPKSMALDINENFPSPSSLGAERVDVFSRRIVKFSGDVENKIKQIYRDFS